MQRSTAPDACVNICIQQQVATHRGEEPAVHDLCDDHEGAAGEQGVAAPLLDECLPLLRGQ
eukprot:1158940-Pelagomonas_calceolata.AAC.3